MMTGPEDEHSITVSFIRQPDEHVAVMLRAGRRAAGRSPQKAQNDAGWFVLWAIAIGAALPVVFHFLREYIFIPIFGLSPSINKGDMAIIWLIPTLILYALVLTYSSWQVRRRLAAMQARIRPGLTITVTITPDGATCNTEHTSMWLAWSEIVDIGLRDKRIEFDLESFATYIPASAFSDQQAQDAAFARILGLWRAAKPVQP